METIPLWELLVANIKLVSKGMNNRHELVNSVDKVMEKMLGLRALGEPFCD